MEILIIPYSISTPLPSREDTKELVNAPLLRGRNVIELIIKKHLKIWTGKWQM